MLVAVPERDAGSRDLSSLRIAARLRRMRAEAASRRLGRTIAAALVLVLAGGVAQLDLSGGSSEAPEPSYGGGTDSSSSSWRICRFTAPSKLWPRAPPPDADQIDVVRLRAEFAQLVP